jgi:hypothetical protein
VHNPPAAGTAPEYLTTAQLGRIYKKHPSTFIRQFSLGARLPDGTRIFPEAIRTPGGWLATREAIDAFYGRLTEAFRNQPDSPARPAARSTVPTDSMRAEASLAASGW